MQICQDQLFSLSNKGPQHLQIDEYQNSQKVARCTKCGNSLCHSVDTKLSAPKSRCDCWRGGNRKHIVKIHVLCPTAINKYH